MNPEKKKTITSPPIWSPSDATHWLSPGKDRDPKMAKLEHEVKKQLGIKTEYEVKDRDLEITWKALKEREKSLEAQERNHADLVDKFNREKEEFEKLKLFHAERLKTENRIAQEYIQKELETLRQKKASFEATMERERLLLSHEKAQTDISVRVNVVSQKDSICVDQGPAAGGAKQLCSYAPITSTREDHDGSEAHSASVMAQPDVSVHVNVGSQKDSVCVDQGLPAVGPKQMRSNASRTTTSEDHDGGEARAASVMANGSRKRRQTASQKDSVCVDQGLPAVGPKQMRSNASRTTTSEDHDGGEARAANVMANGSRKRRQTAGQKDSVCVDQGLPAVAPKQMPSNASRTTTSEDHDGGEAHAASVMANGSKKRRQTASRESQAPAENRYNLRRRKA